MNSHHNKLVHTYNMQEASREAIKLTL